MLYCPLKRKFVWTNHQCNIHITLTSFKKSVLTSEAVKGRREGGWESGGRVKREWGFVCSASWPPSQQSDRWWALTAGSVPLALCRFSPTHSPPPPHLPLPLAPACMHGHAWPVTGDAVVTQLTRPSANGLTRKLAGHFLDFNVPSCGRSGQVEEVLWGWGGGGGGEGEGGAAGRKSKCLAPTSVWRVCLWA